MIVSRETSFSSYYSRHLFSSSVSFDDLSVIPYIIKEHPGSCVVVDDDLFDIAFGLLVSSNVPNFCCLTNLDANSPSGFVSEYDSSFAIFKKLLTNPKKIVLVNSSYYGAGDVVLPVDRCDFTVNGCTDYGDLVSKLKGLSLERVSTVCAPGEFALRGGVVDVFPVDSLNAYRVDFSESSPSVYVFCINSQLTEQKVGGFDFCVQEGGGKSISVNVLLDGLNKINLNKTLLKKDWVDDIKDIRCCSYDRYLENKSDSFVVDLALDTVGLGCGGVFYVPGWFLGEGVLPRQNIPTPSGFTLFENMSIGDYVVHDDFGVAKYCGVVSSEGGQDSSVLLEFFDAKINVTLKNISSVGFLGHFGENLTLSSVSKKGLWKKRVDSVSRSVDFFVQQLLNQHLSRVGAVKKRNSLDVDLVDDFVRAFKYQETADQETAYRDVYFDLTSTTPMDRLLCGDVGFGKTEIAVRAAFLTVLGGGSVVVLAPTTVLCYQLYQSFKKRLSAFSVKVGLLSRIISKTKSKQVLDDFNSSSCDVLVGTHKILSSLDQIKKIDLLIVDEEHRFGVKQKESVVEAFPFCDVLQMSATPIPRTLQKAFSGIKTISTISTPPLNRKPIISRVCLFDENKIFRYIKSEVSRGGQVYFLHNQISSLASVKKMIELGCPNVSVRVAHGKISPMETRGIINDFISKQFHVLLATSIIENGLDIPNVNSIIINNAHRFGLSQLHQIRGRVGRHFRQAFAYFLVPRSSSLTALAKKRLKAIEKYSALGSGFNLSLSDLEIRGAGALFGYAQSGGAKIGFDLYSKILKNNLLGGDGFLGSVEIDVYEEEAYIPCDYIFDDGLRLDIYKKITLMEDSEVLDKYVGEVSNRFGSIPPSFLLFINQQKIKIMALGTSVISVYKQGASLCVVFLPFLDDAKTPGFLVWVRGFCSNVLFRTASEKRLVVTFNDVYKNNEDIYVFLYNMLNKFKEEFC